MTELNNSDRKDGNSQQLVTHSSRARRLGIARLGLLALMMIFALGNQRCPPDPNRPPAINCQDFALLVEPGTCVAFANPCADHEWSRPSGTDGFELDLERPAPEEQVWLNTERDETTGETIRSICVGADSPLHKPFGIGFTYERRFDDGTGLFVTDYGRGSVILTVAHPLTVSVTATPSNIAFGQSSQLFATASGGIPPYFYSWAYDTNLDRNNVAAPVARPPATENFTVTVIDSGSQHVSSGPVTVFVRPQLTVTANPDSIRPGDPVGLAAIPQGGSPPFTFTWTPEVGLDDPHRADPIARPTTTTTYHVTATDTAGAVLEGSVTVVVSGPERLSANATASPSSINFGETSQLDVAVTGGVPPYTYFWTSNPSSAISNRQIRNPVASPEATTSYGVSVTDSQNSGVFDAVTVNVGPPPTPTPTPTATPTPTPTPTPLTASFVFNVTCCPTLNLDASASTGNIVSYTWDLSWTAASPDRVTSSPTSSFTIREFDRGTITLTVTDAAGNTATTTRNF